MTYTSPANTVRNIATALDKDYAFTLEDTVNGLTAVHRPPSGHIVTVTDKHVATYRNQGVWQGNPDTNSPDVINEFSDPSQAPALIRQHVRLTGTRAIADMLLNAIESYTVAQAGGTGLIVATLPNGSVVSIGEPEGPFSPAANGELRNLREVNVQTFPNDHVRMDGQDPALDVVIPLATLVAYVDALAYNQ